MDQNERGSDRIRIHITARKIVLFDSIFAHDSELNHIVVFFSMMSWSLDIEGLMYVMSLCRMMRAEKLSQSIIISGESKAEQKGVRRNM